MAAVGCPREGLASSGVSCAGQAARSAGIEWEEFSGSRAGLEQAAGAVTVPRGAARGGRRWEQHFQAPRGGIQRHRSAPGGGGARGPPCDSKDDSFLSVSPQGLLGPARGLCDWNGNLCPLGMLSKCQALMRFPTMSRGSCEACATHRKFTSWMSHGPATRKGPLNVRQSRKARERCLGPGGRGVLDFRLSR